MVMRNPYSKEGSTQTIKRNGAEQFRVRLLDAPDRKAAIEKYQRDLTAWKDREREAIEKIRAKLGNPAWCPRSWHQLGIGTPPENPSQTTWLGPLVYEDIESGEPQLLSAMDALRMMDDCK